MRFSNFGFLNLTSRTRLTSRIQGEYQLVCHILDLSRGAVQTVETKSFSIYPPQTYPGILGKLARLIIIESTELSKCFYKQGIAIRSGTYSKKVLLIWLTRYSVTQGGQIWDLPIFRLNFDPFL